MIIMPCQFTPFTNESYANHGIGFDLTHSLTEIVNAKA